MHKFAVTLHDPTVGHRSANSMVLAAGARILHTITLLLANEAPNA